MQRAPVPKTTVDKYGHMSVVNGNIRRAWEIFGVRSVGDVAVGEGILEDLSSGIRIASDHVVRLALPPVRFSQRSIATST